MSSICSARSGSPPRVWGQLPGLFSGETFPRFTPTRVGTTGGNQGARRCGPVHPHACGDNAGGLLSEVAVPGSPPRVWGQLDVPYINHTWARFTPTRVGTTSDPPVRW